MAAIFHRAFAGMKPRQAPELLQPGEAALARNVRLDGGDMEPWNEPSDVLALTSVGAVTSIYRYGQDSSSETQYWFQFTTDVNVLKGPIDDDTEERTYWTGDGYPKKTKASLALGVAPYPSASLRMGLPAGGSAPTVTVNGSPTDPDDAANTVIYVVCYRSSWSEVGKPSTESAVVTYRPGQTPRVTLPGSPSGAYDITHVQIYRSNSGSSSTQFQFAAEVAVGTAYWDDTVDSDELGELLPSQNYDEPDDDMVGLVNVANAYMCGFFGNQLCPSEPGVPYAYPIRYRQSVDAPIVAIAPFDQSILVSTKKSLYVFTGLDPRDLTSQKLTDTRVCVSKRSMIEALGGVVYASAVGLMLVTSSGLSNLTDALMTRKDWQAYKPDSMTCWSADNRVFVSYDTGTTQGMLVLTFGSDANMVEFDLAPTAGFVERSTDTLYLVVDNTIVKWNGGEQAMTGVWRSGVTWYPAAVTMRTAKVDADVYPVTFMLYADGQLRFTKTVQSADTFRLPSGFRAKRYQYEVQYTGRVSAAGMASSTEELYGASQ